MTRECNEYSHPFARIFTGSRRRLSDLDPKIQTKSLAIALREFGKIERTQFLLQNIRDPELRRRIHVGFKKAEARNALARAVIFNRLAELWDRTHENQKNRASGLNLAVAAIVL